MATGDIVIEEKNVEVSPKGIAYGASYFPDYNEVDQGATGDGRSTKDYIDTIAANSATLVFQHNSGGATTTYTFSTSETIPSNIHIIIEKGAILSIAAAQILTINGPFNAGLYQVFSGAGSVVFGNGAIESVSPTWWGFLSSASAATNKAAIDSAVASLGIYGGLIKLPFGAFSVAPDIIWAKRNVTISGSSEAYGYEGGEKAGTRITFTTGTYGFDLSHATNNYYGTIKNLYISGNSVLENGIAVAGVGNLIENVTIEGCTVAGLRIMNPTNQLHVDKCSFSYNTAGYGVYVASAGGSSYTTTFSIKRTTIRANDEGLVAENGMNVTVEDCVIESNVGYGLRVYKPLVTDQFSHWNFNNCWLENNGTGGVDVFQAFFDSGTHNHSNGPPVFIEFYQCFINALNTTDKYVDLTSVAYLKFRQCQFGGSTESDSHSLGNFSDYVSYEGFEAGYGMPTQAQLALGNGCWKSSIDTGSVGGEISTKRMRHKQIGVRSEDGFTGGLLTISDEVAVDITAAASIKVTFNIPIGATLLGAQFRVDEALAAGETWDAGWDGGKTQAIAINEAVAVNTKISVPWSSTDTAGTLSAIAITCPVSAAALTDIYITKNGGGAFTAQGNIRVWVYYKILESLSDS